MTQESDDPRRRAAQAMRIGLILFVISGAIVLLPLLLDLRSLNRFLVAFGLIGVFIGLGCVANGAIDLVRGRSR